MPSYKRKDEDPSAPPTPPRWKGADSLELVCQFNERVLTLLKEAGAQPWSQLSAESIRRAARFPFVIVDVMLTDEPWWRAIMASLKVPARNASLSLWPAEVAQKLTGEVVVFAFHTARWDRSVARLVLGMAPGVVEVVRALTPQQLDEIPRRYCGALRLRWQEDREFWARLIAAAQDGDGEALADIHLHAKLLLSGELMGKPARSAKTIT